MAVRACNCYMPVNGAGLQFCLDCGSFGFVAGLFEQCEHVALVGFDAGLVERIYVEDIARDTTGGLEEVNQLAEIVFAQAGDGDAHVGHSAVHVGDTCAEFGHLVHFVNSFAGYVVEAVEIGVV